MRELLAFWLLIALSSAIPIDKLKITSPKELSEKFPLSGISINNANFGYVPYGKNLMGTLYRAKTNLACSILDTKDIILDDPTPIFLVDRGECTFVTKSKYAQIAGAKLVIIIDNTHEDVNSIMMRDDGLGKEVSIPTIMISNEDGNKITQFMKSQNGTVSLAITFPAQRQKERVSFEVWISSSDKKSYEMIEELTPLIEKLEDNIDFKPRYVTWFCKFCAEQNYKVKEDKCLSGGRYCSPDADAAGTTHGRDFMFESLRQLCIRQKSSLRDYLSYVKAYNQKCLVKNVNLTSCAGRLVNDFNLDQGEINYCITTSFVKTGAEIDMGVDDNWLLSKERASYTEEKIQKWPGLLINDETYKGDNDNESLLEEVCQKFFVQPSACLKIERNVYTTSEGIKLVVLLPILIVSILLIMAVVLFLYRRHLKNQLNKDISIHVNTALSQYFALGDRSFHVQSGVQSEEKPQEKSVDKLPENEEAPKKDEI